MRALILTPTRELAAQVEESVRTYGKHLPLRSTVVSAASTSIRRSRQLRRGVDILVATPGRLLDHLDQKTVDLSHVEILVLDEADRMLDMGFIPDIKRILAVLPAKRQNLLFSATFSDEIRRLATELAARSPRTIEVARAQRARPRSSTQQVVPGAGRDRKRALLDAPHPHAATGSQVLVFMRTKHGANRLAEQLERDGISAEAIHGDKSQAARSGRSPIQGRQHHGAGRDRHRRARPRHRASCRTSSTTSCRTCPRTTCTASAAPAAPALPGEAISLVCARRDELPRATSSGC